MSLSSRLAKLSYTQLLELAVDACESSPELKSKANALIAEVAPLPSWCVDILLSPDLQTQRAPTPAAAAPRPQGMRVAAQAAEDDGKGKGKKRGGGRGGRKRSG